MRIILFTAFLILFYSSSAYASSEVQELKTYVENLIDKGYEIFNDQRLSDTERTDKSRQLIRSHLHLDWMAKHTLGRHRRVISKNKIAEFSKIYSQFVVKAYTDLSTSYNGEKAVLKRIRQINDDMFIVNTEILRPGGQLPIKVDYLVHKIENGIEDIYLIGDIITEGISILNSQQAEFNSVISSSGIDALIADLQSRAK